MRSILLSLALLFLPLPAMAQADAAAVSKGCHEAVTSDASDPLGVGRCEGMLTAVGGYLQKVHVYYQAQFPNLSYPIHDQALLRAYLATDLMVGPNDCFPAGTRIINLAGVLDRYAVQHPDEVVGESFPFVVKALDDTYRCRPGHE